MSDKYEPKVGDRVRITHEGVVERVTAYGEIDVRTDDGKTSEFFADEVMTVKLLKPAARTFRPGTVVKTNLHDSPLVRTFNGGWRWGGDGTLSQSYATDADVERQLGKFGFEVLYEPPA